MKVSVVIPNFNHGRFLSRSIESVLNQTHTNLELFVYDNRSVDNSMEVAKQYEAKDIRVRALQLEKHAHSGAEAVHTALMTMASGDIGIWLNADDAFFPNTLETLVQYFDDPKVGFVRTGITAYYNDDIGTSKYIAPPKWDKLSDIFNECKVYPESPFSMNIFRDVQGISAEDIRFWDWDFWVKCALQCSTGKYEYRTHDEAMILRRIHGIEGYCAIDEEHWEKQGQPGPGIRYGNLNRYLAAGAAAIHKKYLKKTYDKPI